MCLSVLEKVLLPMDIYSYPDSGLAEALTDRSELFGSISLIYASSGFSKKAGYSYQIDLSEQTGEDI